MSEERPGFKIDHPMQEHIVLSMLILVNMARPGWERDQLLAALVEAVESMWDWDKERLHDELANCLGAMQEAGSRFTVWFTPERMEFDMKVPDK